MDHSYLPAFGSGVSSKSVEISIGKVENGYTVQLQTFPSQPKPRRPDPGPFVGADPDELIDKILDGMSALLRTINDKGAGEDWKEGGDRQQVREAFRVMFPDLARKVDHAVDPEEYVEPRHESRVFESKLALIEYLDKNL